MQGEVENIFAYENKSENVSSLSLLHSCLECHLQSGGHMCCPLATSRRPRSAEVLMGSSSKCVTVPIHSSSYTRLTGSVTQCRHS